jgi:hypothetical protein
MGVFLTNKKERKMDSFQALKDLGPAFLHYTLPKVAKISARRISFYRRA